jgi:hypothetical protein
MPRFRNSPELIEIAGEARGRSVAAIRWFDGTRTVWLPLSQVEESEDGKSLLVPEWLALEKELI